jgi:hypothetical protein
MREYERHTNVTGTYIVIILSRIMDFTIYGFHITTECFGTLERSRWLWG